MRVGSYISALSLPVPSTLMKIAILAGTCITPGEQLPQGLASRPIPLLAGKTLAGKNIRLQEDLHSEPAVLIVGFSRQASAQGKSWGKAIASMRSCAGALFQWYELPILSAVPRFLRGLATNAIRCALPLEAQAHFVPIYQDEARWKGLVDFKRSDEAYALALPNGRGVARVGRGVARVWHGLITPKSQDEVHGLLNEQCERP